MPSARVRATPSLNVSAISESAVGATMAPPAPWTTRETISCAKAMTSSAMKRWRGAFAARTAGLPVIDSCDISSFPPVIGSGARQLRRAVKCRPAGGCLAQAQVLVDPDQPKLHQLVAREGRRGGRVVDDLGPDQRVIATPVGDDAPTGGEHVSVPGSV